MLYEVGEETHWWCTKCHKEHLTIIGMNGEYALCECSACGNTTKIIMAYGYRKYKKHDISELQSRFEKQNV